MLPYMTFVCYWDHDSVLPYYDSAFACGRCPITGDVVMHKLFSNWGNKCSVTVRLGP